jgi:iron-sulfur cluster repair protein YtfE (RIC family)
MKKSRLDQIIQEEISRELQNTQLVNEIFDLEAVKYSATIRKQVDNLVNAVQKTSSLTKPQVASILNDIILALDLDRTQMTMYMNMIKQQRKKYQF